MKAFIKHAKEELKTNVHLKYSIYDIKRHFKNKKHPLNYHIYREESRVNYPFHFDILLDYYGFTAYYDKKRYIMLIKPKRRTK